MSHISTYALKIKEVGSLLELCEEKGINVQTGKQQYAMFGSQTAEGVAAFKLPGWKYPVVIGEDGSLLYDHFGSTPESFGLLGELLQEHNVRQIVNGLPYDQISGYEISEGLNGEKVIEILYN